MQTKLSTKGQIVLPGPVRRRLGLRTGDALDVNVEGGRVVLTPRQPRKSKAKIITDPVSGSPVITLGPDAPVLTRAEVRDILSNFP